MSRQASDRREFVPIRPAVASARPATIREWEEAFEACGHATFFHGPLWSELWQAYTAGRYRPSPRRIEFSDGLVAVLSLTAERTRLGVERHHLSPAGTYGGWLSADTLSQTHAELLTEEVLRAPSLIWRRSPADRKPTTVSIPGAIEEDTHLVDLSDGADAVVRRWRREARGSANRATKAGLKVREASTADDWLAYYALYREALARWGDTSAIVYDRSLFTILAELDYPSARLWLAELDGVACAGALVFTHGRGVVGWHSANAPARCPGSANLLLWRMFDAFAHEGMTTFDLNPSGGRAGVERFKESLGGVRAATHVVARRQFLEHAAAAVRRVGNRRATRHEEDGDGEE
jgi:hypothetical protein